VVARPHGCCLNSGAYGLVIWAQAHGSIAVVGALRETSVVFATLIAVCLFGEGWGARRIVATVAVVAGLTILHVG
jgi:drug/metabolite transporter (DMT)-like permease